MLLRPNKEVKSDRVDHRQLMEETPRIHNLLLKPFGPFRDSLVLEKKCNTTAKESVVLTSLMMECGGDAIGCVAYDFTTRPTTNPLSLDSTKLNSEAQTQWPVLTIIRFVSVEWLRLGI